MEWRNIKYFPRLSIEESLSIDENKILTKFKISQEKSLLIVSTGLVRTNIIIINHETIPRLTSTHPNIRCNKKR